MAIAEPVMRVGLIEALVEMFVVPFVPAGFEALSEGTMFP